MSTEQKTEDPWTRLQFAKIFGLVQTLFHFDGSDDIDYDFLSKIN